MTLPIPPSDSLYKFTAIGGLILVVLSLYVPWQMDSDLRIAANDLELEWSKWGIELESVGESIKDMDKQIYPLWSDFMQEWSNKYPNLPDAKFLQHQFTTLQAKMKDMKVIQTQLKQLRILQVQGLAMGKKQALLRSQTNRLVWISSGTLGIGILMVILGFWNWYFKFQIHQDRIIKAQAEQWTKAKTMESQNEEIHG